MPLDNDNSQLLYIQLYDILKKEIDSGVYKKGERFPTEQELIKIYDVSRITVRKALERLSNEGSLVRHRGRGTFVTSEKLVRPIYGCRSFSTACKDMGCTPGAKVIKSIITVADKDDIEELKIGAEEKVIVIERIRYANSVPVSIEIDRFSERFSFLLDEDLNNCSMFAILQAKYNIFFASPQKILELVFANYETSKHLSIPTSYPLISLTGVVYDLQGNPSYRSHQLIVGDKFKLIV